MLKTASVRGAIKVAGTALVLLLCQRYYKKASMNEAANDKRHRERPGLMGKLDDIKESVQGKYRSKIRERAITQAKARIALSEKKFQDFTQDELEIVVRDEEDKVKRSLKQSAVVALLITLGLS